MDQQDVLWLNTVIVSESALQIAHAVWPVLFLLMALFYWNDNNNNNKDLKAIVKNRSLLERPCLNLYLPLFHSSWQCIYTHPVPLPKPIIGGLVCQKPPTPTTPAVNHIPHPLQVHHSLYLSWRWHACIFNIHLIWRFVMQLPRRWKGSRLTGPFWGSFLMSSWGGFLAIRSSCLHIRDQNINYIWISRKSLWDNVSC